jgi:hypothetical protein
VAQELNQGALEGTFSATPSQTAVRAALLLASLKGLEVLVCDVQTAFLHASVTGAGDAEETLLLRPPKPLARPGVTWLLKKALYGLRRAPALWQAHLCSVLGEMGFSQPNRNHVCSPVPA